jgi:hypothetical protein
LISNSGSGIARVAKPSADAEQESLSARASGGVLEAVQVGSDMAIESREISVGTG